MKHGEIALPMRLKKEYRTPSHTTNPKSETMLKLAAHSNGCTSSALTTTNAAAHAFYPPLSTRHPVHYTQPMMCSNCSHAQRGKPCGPCLDPCRAPGDARMRLYLYSTHTAGSTTPKPTMQVHCENTEQSLMEAGSGSVS